MMKIGIFETEHFEGAYPVIRLFDNDSNQITVFTYESSYRQLSHLFGEESNRYEWVIKNENDSKYRFIYSLFREVKKRRIRLLYLNTVSNNFILYAALIMALPQTRIVLTLHDINGYFRYKPAFGLRPWVRYSGKRLLMSIVNEFNVVSLTMVDYLKKKLPENKKVHCVPGAVFDESALSIQTDFTKMLHIVIPGTLDWRRRSYGIVFELLGECKFHLLPVKVTLLGGCSPVYGQEILERCRDYAQHHDNLIFYDSKLVDQPEFDRVMEAAHIVLIPSVINTMISDGVAETYGLSISSGNIFDVIKHAKPFIVPKALRIEPFLQKSCFQYTSLDELTDFFREIFQNKEKYPVMQQAAIEASRNYTLERVRQRNPDLFG